MVSSFACRGCLCTYMQMFICLCVCVCSAATMPVERMRMRPWLEEQINSCQIPGLKWVNKVSTHSCTHTLNTLNKGLIQGDGRSFLYNIVRGKKKGVETPTLILKAGKWQCINDYQISQGKENLPDPVDACCSSWLGPGEGCSSLHEMGHTYW